MADVEDAIYSRLTNDATVSGLVSSRVYPFATVPQSPTYPYVTYQLINLVERSRSMTADDGLRKDRYQIDVWSESYSEMVSLSNAVNDSLNRWSGTEASVTVQGSYHEDSRDLHEDELRIYRRSLDYEIAWNE